MDMGYIAALGSELVNDPLTLGYTVHNQAEWQNETNAANDLALLTAKNYTLERPTISASELFEAFDQAEWASRTASQKDDIRLILSLGDNIQISTGTKARDILVDATADDGGNGIATNTRANLLALVEYPANRAEVLAESSGFGQFNNIKLGQIQLARREQP